MDERTRIAIGIDPGVNGGIVALSSALPEQILHTWSLENINRYELRNSFRALADHSEINNFRVYACIERLTGFIGEGKGKQKKNVASAHTMFTMGRSYGNLEMALVCARISFTEVMPQVWQRHFKIDPRKDGESKSKWKTRLSNRARELFPDVDIPRDLSDAFLIAQYCRNLRTW